MKKILVAVFSFLCIINTPGTVWAQNLIVNGDFEAGSTGWTAWDNSGFGWGGGPFTHRYAPNCTLWIPTPYPFSGTNTHCQESGTQNIHGGLFQVVTVVPGKSYDVSGQWSGGVNGLYNTTTLQFSWFEIIVYDGAVPVTTIDAGPGVNDVQIAKEEFNNASAGAFFSFGPEGFNGTFIAQSNQVTLAFKTGRYNANQSDAIATYHDNISITLTPPPPPPQAYSAPAMGHLGMALFVALAGLASVLYIRRSKKA